MQCLFRCRMARFVTQISESKDVDRPQRPHLQVWHFFTQLKERAEPGCKDGWDHTIDGCLVGLGFGPSPGAFVHVVCSLSVVLWFSRP